MCLELHYLYNDKSQVPLSRISIMLLSRTLLPSAPLLYLVLERSRLVLTIVMKSGYKMCLELHYLYNDKSQVPLSRISTMHLSRTLLPSAPLLYLVLERSRLVLTIGMKSGYKMCLELHLLYNDKSQVPLSRISIIHLSRTYIPSAPLLYLVLERSRLVLTIVMKSGYKMCMELQLLYNDKSQVPL